MPEIIPNLHPAVVHFPIALTLVALLFSIVARVFSEYRFAPQWAAVGHWSLRFAAIMAIVAVVFGLLAYNSVNHDESGHLAMQLHRNWAIPTAIGLILAGAWDIWKYEGTEIPSVLAVASLFVLSTSVMVTGWLGGEVVFRHGIGVLRIPVPEMPGMSAGGHNHAVGHADEGHAHEHGSTGVNPDVGNNADKDNEALPHAH